MSSFLLSIGRTAGFSLPVIFTALSCGAALPVPSLNVFSVSQTQDCSEEPASLASSLSACHRLFPDGINCPAFQSDFSFSSCIPEFSDLRSLAADPDTSLLFDALRGKSLPFSYKMDREAVEWCFADLLSRPDNSSIQPFFSWLSCITAAEDHLPVRLALLADLSDSFSGGVTLALLPFLRSYFDHKSVPVYISLLALAETSSPLPETFFPCLSSAIQGIDSRCLLRTSEEEKAHGADAMWLLSLPSSMVRDRDSHRVTALAAARILGSFFSSSLLPPVGFHTKKIDGTLSLSSLGDQAPSFAAFLRASVWLLSDLFPALRSYLSHPVRLRSIALSPKTVLFRQIFSAVNNPAESEAELSLLDTSLRTLLGNILSFLRSVPDALRSSGENASFWQQAVNACGRYITVASEYDTSAAEARESGLDSVRPVHRVSMADTDEEQLVRKLQEMRQQLEDEDKSRQEILSRLGGYRAFQVRLDCYSRCVAALKEAKEKNSIPDNHIDHLTLLKRERRVRLLEAAVVRCRDELYAASMQASVSALPSVKTSVSDPYSYSVLEPETCHMAEALLSASGDNEIPRMIPVLPSFPEADAKERLRALVSACRDISAAHPAAFLSAEVFSACRAELQAARFHPDAVMPDIPLLPDLIAEVPLIRLCDVLSRMPVSQAAQKETGERRGILAMLLLRHYRRLLSSEASLAGKCCLTGTSPVLRYWLSSMHTDRVYVLSLEQGQSVLPFALVIPGRAFLPARRVAAHREMIPSFVTWYDQETDTFSDPCSFLGEGDRMLLRQFLSSCLEFVNSSFSPSLHPFLQEFLRDLSRENEPFVPDDHLRTRLQAVCGLGELSAYKTYITRQACVYEHSPDSDPVGSCLVGMDSFPPLSCTEFPEDVLYLYRGVPFAREDSRLLLADPRASGEEYALSRLDAECAVLSESSDDYRDALLKNLQALLNRNPSVLPEVCESVSSLLKDASRPVDSREPAFVWPWDEKSPSIMTILHECLGNTIPADALHPFSDLLTVFPARGRDVVGDMLMSSMCTVLPRECDPSVQDSAEFSPDAVLPPLSPSFGSALCIMPEGRTLLKPGLLTFERFRDEKPGFSNDISDSFRVTLTLDGAFPVHLVRVYSPEETLYLYAHDIPTVAVWPSVPFRPEDWRAYYVYAHLSGNYSASVLTSGGIWSEIPLTSENRRAAVLDSFPVCLSLSIEDKTAGILPNLLPEPLVKTSDPVEICMDFGSAGTSVIFSSGQQRRPLQGPVMVRTLLNNPSASRDLLRREFIPAVPVSALLPTVSRIFRNAPGKVPQPFADGIILMSSDMEDLLSTPSDAIYTSLKWEEEKGHSGFLCLHQVMLMAALQARFEGASAISWRFPIPDEMAKEGRETLMNLFLSLSKNVLDESGYLPAGGDTPLPVSFASESSALGAYFRFCAPEDTRGGFMVLDLGACTADISLFLRGREQAVRTCQIPLGVHYMLLPTLLRDPDLLSRDFGTVADEPFRRDLSLLSRALSAARTDPVALRRARVSLDYFISDYLPLLHSVSLQMASCGHVTFSGSLLLLHFSYLMMLSGLVLLQLAADPSRNDFLPEQMTLCISGRGSSLLESLPPPLKTSLWHFLSMFRNRRVSSLSLMFSAEKKLEIPVGLSLLQEVYHMLPPAPSIPASVAVRPSELLPEFLLRFRGAFPMSAEMLFPGVFSNDYYQPFTDRGNILLSSSVEQSFPSGRTEFGGESSPRPYDALSAWICNLLEIVQTSF